jgi:hypothetical protein
VSAPSGDVGSIRWDGLQLREANSTHTPHYDEPDETAQRNVHAQRDMVRLGVVEPGATHARLFARRIENGYVLQVRSFLLASEVAEFGARAGNCVEQDDEKSFSDRENVRGARNRVVDGGRVVLINCI